MPPIGWASRMLKQDGQWREVEWPDALEYVRHALLHVKQQHGPEAIGALAAPSSTLEELHLLAKLVRGIGSDNIDHRLRQTDFSGDAAEQGVPWLGMPVQDIDTLDRVLLVGSFLRKDHPLLSARLRHARAARLPAFGPARGRRRPADARCAPGDRRARARGLAALRESPWRSPSSAD